MTPHTAQPWMKRGWPAGVEHWREALHTEAARQLTYITHLLFTYPYLTRIPDQALLLAGQNESIHKRVQVTRDGTSGDRDATYILTYLSASCNITLNTSVIAGEQINLYWFDPRTGKTEVITKKTANPGELTIPSRGDDLDWVLVVEDASKKYKLPRMKKQKVK